MAKRKMRSNKRKVDWRARGQQGKDVLQQLLWRRVLPLALAVAIAVGVPFVVFDMYVFMVSGQVFAVKDISIKGAMHIPRQEVLSASSIVPGMNVFDVVSEHVEVSLLKHSWVKEVQVNKVLPDRIEIVIVEHDPVALILDAPAFALVDAHGVPFVQLESSTSLDEFLARLPLITGLSKDSLADAGASGNQARRHFSEAMNVLDVWRELGYGSKLGLSEVHVDSVLGISLVLLESGAEVRLGWGRYRERLQRFGIVYDEVVHTRGMEIDYILVDQDEDISRVAVGPALRP